MILRTFALIFSICIVDLAAAQDKAGKWRLREKGFISGIGRGIDSVNIPEGRYTPIVFMVHMGVDILKKTQSQNNPGIFTIYAEPQVNPVIIKKGSNTRTDLEFGINIGFKHMYPLRKNIYAYLLIGSGPHFITVHTIKQTRGFIFSDNFGAGFYFFNKKDMALNLGFRLRHMSNANIQMPNSGINTFNYYIGISKVIR
jgi:lipid A 3-O-deacylase